MEDIDSEIALKISKELEEKSDELGKYLKDKLENFNHGKNSNHVQDRLAIIQTQRHQLAISRILVNVHGKSPMVMVKAHYNLADSYSQADYFDAAADHLISASKINMDLFESVKEARVVHIGILNLLGKCYLHIGRIEEAKSILEQALASNKVLNGKNDFSNAQILNSLAKVHCKLKDYGLALDRAYEVWEVFEEKFGLKHEIMIDVYNDIADIHILQKDNKNAVDVLRRKLNLMIELGVQSDFLAETYEKLGLCLQELFVFPQALDSFREAEKIFIQNNGVISRKASKLKRKICNVLVKVEEYEEAVRECKELEEIDKSLYGEFSNQHAKDLKAVATIFMIMGKFQDALKLFNKALEIYSRQKNKKMIKEVKEKIEVLKKNHKDLSD